MKYKSQQRIRENVAGYLFALPWIIGFVLLIGGPTISTIWLGFTRYDVFRPAKFIGMYNYVRMFTDDDVFIQSVFNTFFYSLFNVPISVIGALLLALLLNNKLMGVNAFKTAFYIPTITTGIAMAMLWLWIFDPGIGTINVILRQIGIKSPPLWFRDPDWVKPTMILVKVVEVGGARMIIFLAGLQNIPTELYEAAHIDGAKPIRRFFSITFPMLSPIIMFNLVVAVIDSFKVFINAYAITNGGPLNKSMFLVLYIYKNAFTSVRMGYASAIATFFIAIVFVLTFIQLRMAKNWVHYTSDVKGKK